MTPTKLLIGQVLVVFAIVIAGVWFATEWCAAELEFQSQLGSPWFVLLGLPVYCPWRLFAWWYWHSTLTRRRSSTRRRDRRVERPRRLRCRDRWLAVAGAAEPPRHHLRLLALGDQPARSRRRPVSCRRRFPGPPRWEVSSP